MKGLLLVFAALQLAYCSCPKGFDLVRDGECRGSVATMKMGFAQGTPKAIEMCASIDSKPIIIHNDEHQSYWKLQAPSTVAGFLFMGLVCNTQSKKWEWSDGSSLDYKPKTGYNEELDKPCTPGWSWDIHPDGFWSYGNDGQVNGYISCTMQLEPIVASGGGCDGFDDDEEDKVCYQVASTAATWRGAEEMCEDVGGNLASIHNLRENSFIRRLAVTQGAMTGVFIGAAKSAGANGDYGWVDGTVWDYENYYPGFPKAGFGDCLAMDTSSSDGKWMNFNCSAKLPVACIRPQHAVVAPTCSGETWTEGQIITSPGFPFSASTPCDYFLTVDAGKKVEAEIILLEANSCCDSLMVYDGYMGGAQIANVTGDIHNLILTTATSNIMRVSWKPQGGVNVKGLQMKFRAV